ncbi:hypothetical protein MicB006_3095 [Micromonospora sp. B006]|nr:hypothetical protein MicB006_3095 [Micromonospora sp. B006]
MARPASCTSDSSTIRTGWYGDTSPNATTYRPICSPGSPRTLTRPPVRATLARWWTQAPGPDRRLLLTDSVDEVRAAACSTYYARLPHPVPPPDLVADYSPIRSPAPEPYATQT